jgi:hypothetical protein
VRPDSGRALTSGSSACWTDLNVTSLTCNRARKIALKMSIIAMLAVWEASRETQ